MSCERSVRRQPIISTGSSPDPPFRFPPSRRWEGHGASWSCSVRDRRSVFGFTAEAILAWSEGYKHRSTRQSFDSIRYDIEIYGGLIETSDFSVGAVASCIVEKPSAEPINHR